MVELAFHRSGITPLGKVVRWFEDKDGFGHVELVINGDAYSCVGNEGLKKFGVRRVPVRSLFNATDPGWVLLEMAVTQRQQDRLEGYCEGSLGKPYDFLSLFGVIVRAGGIFPNSYICSEWVANALTDCGLYPEIRGTFLTPSELYAHVAGLHVR